MTNDPRFDAVGIGLGFGLFLLCVVAALSGCTSTGACIFHPHASLCDPQDFDPKCLLDRCGDVDGGP